MTVGLLPAPTEEQTMVLDATARFIAAEFPLDTVRRRVDGEDVLDDAYPKAAAALGWFGLLADDAHGGGSASGNGLVDAAAVAAERGAALQPGPFPCHSAVVRTLSEAGATDVLPDLIEGRAWATWVRGAELRDGALHGTVTPVADAASCTWLLVDGVLVRADAPGVTLRSLEGLDLTRRWYAIDFDGVQGTTIDGPDPAPVAAVLAAAETVGAMHANLALAVEYAKARIAFGRPIGSFQAVKHMLADASLWLEMAKGLVFAAAEALGGDRPEGPTLAHSAASFTGEYGVELAHTCFQTFGGIGFTWEHDQHLYLRRLAADQVAFGPPEWHRERVLALGGV